MLECSEVPCLTSSQQSVLTYCDEEIIIIKTLILIVLKNTFWKVALDSELLDLFQKCENYEIQKWIVHYKLCCICENDGKSSSWLIGMDKRRNTNNSAFSPTSTVMFRNIALAYKSVTTWTLSWGGRLTSIEIFWCVLGEPINSMDNPGYPYIGTAIVWLIYIYI